MWSRLVRLRRWLSFLACITTGIIILLDNRPGFMNCIGFLPLCHGFIQLITSKRKENLVDVLVRFFFFIRNCMTPLLMFLTNYETPTINIRFENFLLKAIVLLLFETICVFLLMRYVKVPILRNQKESSLLLNNCIIVNLLLGVGLLITVLIYFAVPETQDTFVSILDPEAAFLLAVMSDEIEGPGGINRILYTLFGFLFSFYRLILPAFIILMTKRYIRSSIIGVCLSLLVISTQFLMITERTMTTLINITVLALFVIRLYPNGKKFLAFGFGTVFVLVSLFFIAMKSNSESSSFLTSIGTISFALQGYIPNVSNLVGAFNLPSWKLSYLLSDIYGMIPFRNTIFGFDFGVNTSELFSERNAVRGQILPLIGQGYYHFGILAPILSVWLVKIAIVSYEKCKSVSNPYLYIYYIYLSIFAAMTPFMYFFGVFGSTFLSGMIVIFFFSKIYENFSRNGSL